MKITIETNGALTKCRVSGHTYENPTMPYFDEPLETCDETTQRRVIEAMEELIKGWRKEAEQ